MPQTVPEPANAAQIDYWNDAAGQTWSRHQARLDRQLEPLGVEAMRVLAPAAGERIVDVGCGCGQTTLALAARVTASGQVTGVDVSEPMLAVARARPLAEGKARPDFLLRDAQTADLGDGAFDALYSRFGVMFFGNPAAAFANLRRALKPGGRLAFVCWRSFDENLWMKAPMDAARPFLPAAAPTDPTAPGPFAFSNPDRVRSILDQAGFTQVTLDPFDALVGGSSLDETLDMALRVGPLGLALRENPRLAPVVADAVRQTLAGYDTPDGVLMPAAVWIVQARAPRPA